MAEGSEESLRDVISASMDSVLGGETVPPDAPALDTSPPEPVTLAVEPELSAPGRTAGRARDEHGRLLPGKAQRDATAPDTNKAVPLQEGAGPVAAAAHVRPADVPSSWKKETWAVWPQLKTQFPQIAAEIERRERDFEHGVSTYKAEADRAREIINVVAPYQAQIQAEGGTPARAIQSLLHTASVLRQGDPMTKIQAVLATCDQFRVPIREFFGQQGNPQSNFLAQQVQQLHGELNTFKTQREQESQAQIQSEISKFSEAHPHFAAVRETMAGLLQSNVASDLQSAYDKAVRLHDDIWQQEQSRLAQEAATKKSQQARETASSARARAVSPRSATPSPAPVKTSGKGIRDDIEAAFDEHVGRV